ncbi:MAG: hypothetical protein AAFU77_13470 [Myxococcota bacterium]
MNGVSRIAYFSGQSAGALSEIRMDYNPALIDDEVTYQVLFFQRVARR